MKTNLLAISFGLAAAVAAMATPKHDGTLRLIDELRREAAVATTHATDLQVIAASAYLSTEADVTTLGFLKKDVNTMGATLAKIEKMRDSLTPGEREVVDRNAPLIREMATDTSSAIRFIRENGGNTWRPVYQKSVDDLAGASGRVSKSLKEFVEVSKLHNKEQRLQQDLGVSGF